MLPQKKRTCSCPKESELPALVLQSTNKQSSTTTSTSPPNPTQPPVDALPPRNVNPERTVPFSSGLSNQAMRCVFVPSRMVCGAPWVLWSLGIVCGDVFCKDVSGFRRAQKSHQKKIHRGMNSTNKQQKKRSTAHLKLFPPQNQLHIPFPKINPRTNPNSPPSPPSH